MTDDAASAKLADNFAGIRYTDYLLLAKRDGRWAIVNKLYHVYA